MNEIPGTLPKTVMDGHVHAGSTDFIPMQLIESSAANLCSGLRARGLPADEKEIMDLYLSNLQDHDCSGLVREMEGAGIAKSVLLLPDFTYVFRNMTLSIEEMFKRHKSILDEYGGSLAVLAGVDPRWGKPGVDLFEKGVKEYGFSGLKLYPPCGYSPSDVSLYPYYEICSQLGLPVMLHSGGTSPLLQLSFSTPVLVDDAARNFPGVNFIIAHGNGTYSAEAHMLCAYRPNLYMDISSWQAFPLEDLHRIFGRGIDHKIIFGTDWPIFSGFTGRREQMETLVSKKSPVSNLKEDELDRFFGGAMASLLPAGTFDGKSDNEKPRLSSVTPEPERRRHADT